MTSENLNNGGHQSPKHAHRSKNHEYKNANYVIASTRPLSPLSLAVQMLTKGTNDRKNRIAKEKKLVTDEPSTTDKLSMSYGLSQEGSDAPSKPTYSFIYTNPDLVSSTWKGNKHRGKGKLRHHHSKPDKRVHDSRPFDAETNLGPFITAMCVAGEENRRQRVAESISNIVSLSGTIFSTEVPADFSGTVSPRYILPGSMKYKEDATDPSMLVSRFKVDPAHLFHDSFESVETVPSVRSMASPVQNPFLNNNDIHDEVDADPALRSNMSDSYAEFTVHLKSFISVSNHSSNVSEIAEDQGRLSDNEDITSMAENTM